VPSAGKPERVTLRDVADRAGVSITTVSFVLSGRHDMRISAATEERVVQAARMLDYRRRLVPRSVLPAGAPAIGLVSDVVATESFAGEMLRGSIAAATERGHVVLMADSEGVDDIERSAISALLSRGVDRFLYATMGTITYSVPDLLRDQRLVLMNNVDPTLGVAAGCSTPGTPPASGWPEPSRRTPSPAAAAWPGSRRRCGTAAWAWPATSRAGGGRTPPGPPSPSCCGPSGRPG
jgi:transcriptional regulator with XRE-family HTH domain